MVPKGPPIRIYVRADVVMMAGNMLKKYGKGHAVYRRALLHLAVIVAHEYQHALRMCLEGVLEDTPSKIIECGMPTTEKTKNGVTYKTGEGGWWWESQVIGGELVSRPHVTETEGVTLLPLALQSFAGDGEWWEVPDKTIENICTKASHWTDLLPIMPGTANVTRGTVPGARLRRTSVNDIDHASQIHIGRMPGPRPRTCGYHDLPTLGIPNLDPKRPNFHKRFASPEEWESSVKTELD